MDGCYTVFPLPPALSGGFSFRRLLRSMLLCGKMLSKGGCVMLKCKFVGFICSASLICVLFSGCSAFADGFAAGYNDGINSGSSSTTRNETNVISVPEPNTTVLTTTTTACVTPTKGNVETTGQKNAAAAAKNYIKIMAFSYNGLISQLEFEGYSAEDATYGVDCCGADWNEQAAKAAKNYLDIMAFSREGLISQLEYDGYTHSQAVYGVEMNGY